MTHDLLVRCRISGAMVADNKTAFPHDEVALPHPHGFIVEIVKSRCPFGLRGNREDHNHMRSDASITTVLRRVSGAIVSDRPLRCLRMRSNSIVEAVGTAPCMGELGDQSALALRRECSASGESTHQGCWDP